MTTRAENKDTGVINEWGRGRRNWKSVREKTKEERVEKIIILK